MKRPDIVTPQSIFGASARYKAPIFQRYYVWGKDEWESLWEDVICADPAVGQFLGAIVLKDMGRPAGPASPSTYLLIDGQQRLTTLYLVFLAMAQAAREAGDDANADFIYQNYLVESKSPVYKGWPKLVPTLQDRHTFYGLLAEALPHTAWHFNADPQDAKPRESKRLRDQWSRITTAVRDATGADGDDFDDEKFNEILVSLQEHLKFIDITLESGDDANATFSRLNAKGVPLELADLVRNEVFSKFGPSESDKADAFFEKSWQPFEKSMPEGSLSAFFPVFAYVVLKGAVTKAAAFSALQNHWRTKTPAQVLAEIRKYSPYFSALTTYEQIDKLPKNLNAQVERLSRMPRTRVTWPFIIEVLRAVGDKRLKETDAARSLRIVESFLVRRALVGREPTGLHAVFKGLWERTKGDPAAVVSKIVTRTIQTPTNGELAAFLRKERSDSRVILNYILAEHEGDYVKAHKYDAVPHTVATIEHVMPRNLSPDWAAVFTPTDHARLIGLLGNLAALSEKQNKGLQDQAWSQKRLRFKGSNFKSTQKLAGSTKWTESHIVNRTNAMITWILERWPELSEI